MLLGHPSNHTVINYHQWLCKMYSITLEYHTTVQCVQTFFVFLPFFLLLLMSHCTVCCFRCMHVRQASCSLKKVCFLYFFFAHKKAVYGGVKILSMIGSYKPIFSSCNFLEVLKPVNTAVSVKLLQFTPGFNFCAKVVKCVYWRSNSCLLLLIRVCCPNIL